MTNSVVGTGKTISLVAQKTRGSAKTRGTADAESPGGTSSGGTLGNGGSGTADAQLTISGTSDRTTQFKPGVSGLQNYPFCNTGSAISTQALALWSNSVTVSNWHAINGFAAQDISPVAAGQYVWSGSSGLDNHIINYMRAANQELALTMGMAPERLKGTPGSFASWLIETSTAYDDFAAICGAIAARYSDVVWYQIWNEFKGLNQADTAVSGPKYIDLYNRCYAAIKAARPAAKVGGPYMTWHNYAAAVGGVTTSESPLSNRVWGWMHQKDLDMLRYFLANKAGADFICFDGMGWGRENETISPLTILQELTFERGYWPDLVTWIRNLNNTTYPGAATLPIIVSETYSGPWGPNSADRTLAPSTSTATELLQRGVKGACNMMIMAKAGVAIGQYWYPQGKVGAGDQGIWKSTLSSDGTNGQVYPLYDGGVALKTYFQPGTALYPVTSNESELETMASAGHVMLVNPSSVARTVSVNGAAAVTLAGYGIKVYDRAAGLLL